MGKKKPFAVTDVDAVIEPVGPREPCPCGSGKRYKVCHGKAAARSATQLVRRPFEGLAGECDIVAMREIVPAASARVVIAGDAAGQHAGREVTITTLLPMSWPAMVRSDGTVQIGLQVKGASGDISRDIAEVLLRALNAEPGESVAQAGLPGPGPRLQDLIDPAAPFDVTVHDGFDYWLEGLDAADVENAKESLDEASASLVPTQRLTSVEAAYWCRIGSREHVRWVLPHDEEVVLDALARLHVTGDDTLGPDSRYIGAFRAHGLIVPVWDVPDGSSADLLDGPVLEFSKRLEQAMGRTDALSADERRARAGLLAGQVTIR